jgi:hypothetical protein
MSRIVIAKALTDRGIPFDWFEMSDRVGGVWAFENPTGRSAAYRSLHIDTSKGQLEFPDFPMSTDTPHYPHHTQVHADLQSHVKYFDLDKKVTLQTEVADAGREEQGTWTGSVSVTARPRPMTHLSSAMVIIGIPAGLSPPTPVNSRVCRFTRILIVILSLRSTCGTSVFLWWEWAIQPWISQANCARAISAKSCL